MIGVGTRPPLSSVFKQLANVINPDAYIFGVLGETEPGFIAASLLAASIAGYNLEGLAIRPEVDQAQIVWKRQNSYRPILDSKILTDISILAVKSYLEARGEPANYLTTISAAFMKIVQSMNTDSVVSHDDKKMAAESLDKSSETGSHDELNPSMVYSTIYNSAREALSYRSGFLRFNLQDITDVDTANKSGDIQETLFSLDLGIPTLDETESETAQKTSTEDELTEKERPTRSSDISESILFWLRETDNVNHISITDNYEQTVINYLATHTNCTNEMIDAEMCKRFPGLFTPDPEFIRICLESYGEKNSTDSKLWHLRPEDIPGIRQKDIETAKRFIVQIGDRLGLLCTEQSSGRAKTGIKWSDTIGELDYWFFLSVSAAIGEVVIHNEQSPKRGFIVIPGSRANLVIYKLRRDPRLSKAFHPIHGTWRFLKYRHLRSLAENPMLSRENLDQLLMLDPLTYSTPQLRLI
jgi:hypothetical protein